MNDLIEYSFEDAQVRVVMIGDNPWWVAADVARVLGYTEAYKMTRNLDEDERGRHILATLGGDQEMNVISESGLFAAILKSRRPEAKRFRRWVTGTVLPSIRKTGRFVMHDDPPPLPAPAIADTDKEQWAVGLGIIREARQIWGREECRQLWLAVGLPNPFANPSVTTDAFAEGVAHVVSGRSHVIGREVAAALRIEWDARNTQRIAAALRLLGWESKRERQNGRPEWVWRPATGETARA